MLESKTVRKIDLFQKFTGIAVTVLRKEKVEYCTYDLKSISGLGIYEKIQSMDFRSTKVQLITHNSMECYGVFQYLESSKDYLIVIGPTLTVRPVARENLRYLSFAHLFQEEIVRSYVHMIPLMPIGDFANALSMFFYQMNEIYQTSEQTISEKVDLLFFQEDDEFTNPPNLEAPSANPLEHVQENLERYADVIRSGNLRKLEQLFNERILFQQFTSENKKANLYSLISISTVFGSAAIEGGLDFYESSALGNTFITLAESFEHPSDFLATFKKMAHGYTNQVHEEQNKYRYSKSIRKAMSYIDRHIHFPLSLETVSKSIGLSRPYLSQLFSKEVGRSLQTYIQERKMEEAENLVRFTKMSMSEIAQSLSFCSQSYFTEVFRRHIGMTPVQYRKVKNKQ